MSSILTGSFVKAYFPTSEQPRVPGLLNIVYVLVVPKAYAVVAYTTSKSWDGENLPLGARVFTEAEARALNQRCAFIMRLDRLARLPITREWFPDGGTIAAAGPRLQAELEAQAQMLLKRHRENVVMLGR